jgi:hypothetical protein
MKHDPKVVKEGLQEILEMDGSPKDFIGARWIIRGAIALIRQMEGDLRRAGFTEYNDPTDKSTIE